MAVDEYVQKALKLMLEHIDRNKGKYDTEDAQNALLDSLIKEHSLEMRYDSQLIKAKILPLDRESFQQLVAVLPLKSESKTRPMDRLFREGSGAIDDTFLKEMQYKTRTRDSGDTGVESGNSGGEDDEDYEPDAESGSDSDNGGKATKGKPKEPCGGSLQERVISDSQSEQEVGSRERDIDNDGGNEPDGDEPQQECLQGVVNLPPEPQMKRRLKLNGPSGSEKKRRAESDGESEATSLRSGKYAEPKRTKVQEDSVAEGGVQPVTRDKQSSVTPSAPGPQNHAEETVSRKEIRKELDAIWQQVQNLTAKIFKDTRADKNAYARVVSKPSKDLEVLYKHLWGEKWASRVRHVAESGMAVASDVVEACMSAAVHLTLLEDLPFDLEEGVLAKVELEVPYFDKILKEHDNKLSMKLLAGQVVRNMVADTAHQDKILNPLAKKLASQILLVLGEQLKTAGATFSSDKAGVDEILYQHQCELEKIVCRLQTLRGTLRVSGADYRFSWPFNDKPFVEEQMEEVHTGKGKRRVAWCVSSGVKMFASKNQVVCVCKARVFTRK
ncbi:hypothetical protein KC323_g5566 [Hortaea werneckii]|nr:hypothetical protein KC323_g5566 [Hortaea werneckii]KAI7350986.1 hypothetical protein KC320_g5266 [Hortaea werneckii]